MRKLLIIFLVVGVVAGCGTANKSASPKAQAKAPGTVIQQDTGAKTPIYDREAVRKHLVDLAKHVPGVKGVNCVVFGNTAVVGIDVDGSLDRSRVGTIKFSVAEALSKDPYGVNAYVTADMDLNQRLKEIGDDMQSGRPIGGLTDELADIVGRIVPQIPRDVKDHQPSKDTGIPKQKNTPSSPPPR
ncbi:MAG: YhcN/YlaJ family sporulation lipoprotein [Paenibacillus sp.]|uniref:Sporulation lipoprotein, YhcN/YlaJ family n=1 Tax=Paenibacillus aquistagni TaxID=1852522 RepID=A0A1X7IEM0_9BACL|nr:YhcN/YlaJ family sporulation lipoprotein [Paenibacillus aquistagni]MBR2569324.1 YhcN/YlaJ family sporulation lipoprotein [Paenibacillus sp.]SMG13099.1 sporulation lipoprotein, YhcN/YlaJ family [Paenibacillus aquistagni]